MDIRIVHIKQIMKRIKMTFLELPLMGLLYFVMCLLKNSYLWIKSHNDIIPKGRKGHCHKGGRR
jgi:hypothetical protein